MLETAVSNIKPQKTRYKTLLLLCQVIMALLLFVRLHYSDRESCGHLRWQHHDAAICINVSFDLQTRPSSAPAIV